MAVIRVHGNWVARLAMATIMAERGDNMVVVTEGVIAEEGIRERRPRQICNTKFSYTELAMARPSGDGKPEFSPAQYKLYEGC